MKSTTISNCTFEVITCIQTSEIANGIVSNVLCISLKSNLKLEEINSLFENSDNISEILISDEENGNIIYKGFTKLGNTITIQKGVSSTDESIYSFKLWHSDETLETKLSDAINKIEELSTQVSNQQKAIDELKTGGDI